MFSLCLEDNTEAYPNGERVSAAMELVRARTRFDKPLNRQQKRLANGFWSSTNKNPKLFERRAIDPFLDRRSGDDRREAYELN
jgi:hypothetical protein